MKTVQVQVTYEQDVPGDVDDDVVRAALCHNLKRGLGTPDGMCVRNVGQAFSRDAEAELKATIRHQEATIRRLTNLVAVPS